MTESLLNKEVMQLGELAEVGKQVNWTSIVGIQALNQLKELGGEELLNGTGEFPIDFNITDEQRLIGVMGLVITLSLVGTISTAITIIRGNRRQKD